MAAAASAIVETLNPGKKAHLYIFLIYPAVASAIAEMLNPGKKRIFILFNLW